MKKIFKTILNLNILDLDLTVKKHVNIGWKKIENSYSYLWGNIHSTIIELDKNQYNYIRLDKYGNVKIIGNIKNNKKVKNWYYFDKKGNFSKKTGYKKGLKNGKWIFYKSCGKIEKIEIYENDELKKYIKDDEVINF